MVDVTEILVHWYAGRKLAEIARSLRVDRKTARKYVDGARTRGLRPGGPEVAQEQWAAWVREWFPELVKPEARSSTFAEIGSYRDYIAGALETNTVSTIHQRLRDEHGLGVGLSSLRRYVRLEFPGSAAQSAITILKDDPPPGEEAQIDYGYLGVWIEPLTGRRRRVWAFSMVLSYSRHMFVRPVLNMTLPLWIECHVAAFQFFDGVPLRWVPDNLKNGILKPDLYDPKFNRTYAEMATHYGALVDPARALHPKDKPRIERPQPYIRDSFWAGRVFASYDEMVDAAEAWCHNVAGQRECRPLGGEHPFQVFLAREADALLPLPRTAFEMVTWECRKVPPDLHVTGAGALYTVPHRYLGREVDVRASAKEITIFLDGELIKTWIRGRKGSKNTDWSDYPPDKVAFLMRTPAWCRRRAQDCGPAVAAVVGDMLTVNVLHRLRAAQGILRLGERFGNERLDAACNLALGAGDPSYRTIKGILQAGYERPAPDGNGAANVPAFLHGPQGIFEELGS